MLTLEQVFVMVKKENDYGQKWAKGSRKLSKVEGVSDADVHGGTTGFAGFPFSIADFKTFAQKYWDEIDLTMSNYTPDGGAVRIRVLKVIALLTRALMIYGQPSDLDRLAGVSSRDFPILSGGLKTMEENTNAEGCLLPTPEMRKIKDETNDCNK